MHKKDILKFIPSINEFLQSEPAQSIKDDLGAKKLLELTRKAVNLSLIHI